MLLLQHPATLQLRLKRRSSPGCVSQGYFLRQDGVLMIQVVELCWTMIRLGVGDWPLVPRAEMGSVKRRGERTCGRVHGFIERAAGWRLGCGKYGERVPVHI